MYLMEPRLTLFALGKLFILFGILQLIVISRLCSKLLASANCSPTSMAQKYVVEVSNAIANDEKKFVEFQNKTIEEYASWQVKGILSFKLKVIRLEVR